MSVFFLALSSMSSYLSSCVFVLLVSTWWEERGVHGSLVFLRCLFRDYLCFGFFCHMEAYMPGRRERVRHHKVVRTRVGVVRFPRVPFSVFFYLATSKKGNED